MLREYPGHLDDTVFGHVTGHLVPGSMFILLGFWWLYNVIYDITISQSNRLEEARPYTSNVWYGPRRATRRGLCGQLKNICEPLCKILLGIIGCIMELTSAHWTLFDEKGNFEHESINNFSHATMFTFFAFSGVVDVIQYYGTLNGKHVSRIGHFVMAFAFFIEGFLFYFHLDGRSALDSHSHSIIYSICFLTSFVFLVESIWSECGSLGLLRCFLVMLQGTWFYQIAFMMYGPRKWSEKSSAAAMFVPIAFSWHCFVLIVIFLAAMFIGEKCVKSSRYCNSNCEAVGLEHLLSNEEDEYDHTKSESLTCT